jgi:hypothetical protein
MAYGSRVAQILALNQEGNRLIPLVSGECSPQEARALLSKQKATDLFANSTAPEAALAGLWAYFSCFEEAHQVAQDIATADGSFWHAILHRQEPDAGNAAYWFRHLGTHPVFSELAAAAAEISSHYPDVNIARSKSWNPFAFIDHCERARQKPRTGLEQVVLEIQRAEWQLLFNYCARPRS